jgi:two-component system chemotaxis response regulator CheY
MIADDSDAIRMILKDALEIGHHEVVAEAANGIEAVEKYNETSPDILLLDIAMPKKDGESALKDIMATHPDAKVIMITASDNLKTINECVSVGALAYIMKPFDFENVLKAIDMALDKH